MYKRVLLKISGEALAGSKGTGINEDVVGRIGDVIAECVEMGVQIAIVVGGGNFWRGRSGPYGNACDRYKRARTPGFV